MDHWGRGLWFDNDSHTKVPEKDADGKITVIRTPNSKCAWKCGEGKKGMEEG